jgi:spore germination cell wall hydrolase CwlJ-like protein
MGSIGLLMMVTGVTLHMEYPVHFQPTPFQPKSEVDYSAKTVRSVEIPNVGNPTVDAPDTYVEVPQKDDWLRTLAQTTNHMKFNKRSIDCLATNIYHEARGESDLGKEAVVWVVVNRIKSEDFPNSMCAVVYQPSQFSWTINHKKVDDWKTWHAIREFTAEYLKNIDHKKDITHGATYYHATSISKPSDWDFIRVGRIGNHIFYRS